MFIFLTEFAVVMMKNLLICPVLLLFNVLVAQIGQTGIGQWREHVPYNKSNSVAAADNIIYCGSIAGVVAFNISNGEIKRYNTISGLNDVGVTYLKYNESASALLIAYKNGNLDILKGNKIINITSIKNANVIGDKTVISIYMDGELAYISTAFGIVVLNMDKAEVKDTYIIGNNSEPLAVNDVYINHDQNRIYAATVNGIRFASLSDNLSDYNYWQKFTYLPDPAGNYNHIDFFDGKLFVNYLTQTYDSDMVYTVADTLYELFVPASFSGTTDIQVEEDRLIISKLYNVLTYDNELNDYGILYIYEDGLAISPNMAIHHQDHYWIADRELGLVKYSTVGSYQIITPDGPNTVSMGDADIEKNILWTTSGIFDPDYLGSINIPEFNNLRDQNWNGLNRQNDVTLDSLYGFVKIKINPFNTEQVFAGSWDKGLLEIKNGKVFRNYNADNTDLYGHTLTPAQGDLIRIGGLDFDLNGNLWITNSATPYALNVLLADGTWKNFNLGKYIDNATIVGAVLARPNGHKWIVLNRAPSNNRLVVYDDNGTIDFTGDDRYMALSTDPGGGNIPGSAVNCIAEDKSGAIFLGTNEGPAVFYNPDQVFENQQDAQRIFVQQEGQTQILLETENIKTITVDGANRKWFGSTNSGAYLMSQDGTEQVLHFTFDNSPLLSDEIIDIEINGENGEVYFCTSEGLISYRGSATEGKSDFSGIEVFPNPVEENYTGPIAITGLAENANVKITDVNGVLIYETTAQGGQAVWDGHSITGNKARNGVYLIFCTSSDGSAQEVSKVLVLNN